jgi:eukaryotic-like serine/threonine-protein kinase
MALASGTRLGPYEIVSAIGAGGMGEVYKTRDMRLKREVALKILPESFASDPDRLARFQREAEVLASLNHPNIAAIYGLEKSDGTTALVMELVEGEDLSQRIAGGPIPIDEALPIAKQIAEALEAAHKQGIIHRDLKPANIKVRADGTVKVLDFGLAKLAEPRAAGGTTAAALSMSPTITSPVMTGVGVLLGTAAYMSPEQARGKAVDKRADIWAFGCVLYEMLAGSRAFAGSDTTETIAAIIRSEPEWSRLPAGTPHDIRRALRRCLNKDPTRRLADIRDVRLDIEEARGTAPEATNPRGHGRERLAWLAACLFTAVAVWAGTTWRASQPSAAPSPQMRVEITTPPTNDLVSMALSPDGEKLAFVASSDHRPKLWLRSLTTGSAEPLPGTDGAIFPFWSPDSHSIGFFANGTLYRIDVDGGSLRALASAPVGVGGAWNRDGDILFTMVPDAPLSRVPAVGGKSDFLSQSPVDRTQRPQPGQRFPQFLPDGRHFLYYIAEMHGVYVGALDSPKRQRLFEADAAAVFVPPARVLFIRAGKLYIQHLDPARLRLEGSAVALAQGVSIDNDSGAAAVSGSETGAFVFRLGAANRQRQFTWFDRSGMQLGIAAAADAGNALNPALSPDGRQVALNRAVDGNSDIWLLDLGRRVLSRFTSDPRPEIYPVWSSDGTRIAYAALNAQGSGFNVYVKAVNDSGEAKPLLDTPQNMIPEDWSRDGRFLSYSVLDSAGRWDVGVLPTGGTGKPLLVTKTPYDEMSSQFSPDGRWISYESDESGRNEIYVQPFPGPGAKTIVSAGGGLQARWRPDGRELFYVAPDGRLMAVSIRTTGDGRTLEPASPVPLFVTRVSSTRLGGSRHEYDVSRDGQKFLMDTFVEQNAAPITLVLNPTPLKD